LTSECQLSRPDPIFGTAAAEITPPENVPLSGFESRKTGSRGVHDPLFARAVVLDDGTTRLGWLMVDLVGIPAATTAAVRAKASALTGVPVDRIMVSCTHTHGGPALQPFPGIDADHAGHQGWLDHLPGTLGGVLGEAAGKLEPVEVLVGASECTDVQHNRRFHMKDGSVKMVWDNPDPAEVVRLGPIDPAVQVLAFKSGDRIRGIIAQFACHATAVTGDNFMITADWPGVVCRELRSEPGAGELWVAAAQGCCGDITPSPPRGTFEVCEAKGRVIAAAVRRAIDAANPVSGETLAAATIRVRLPRKNAGLDSTPTGEFYDAEVQAFRIGDVAVVGLPGECFVGIGLAIKAASPFRTTFVGSYTNDYDDDELGYIPTATEYEGGYEVTASRVAPGADAILGSAAREALAKLA